LWSAIVGSVSSISLKLATGGWSSGDDGFDLLPLVPALRIGEGVEMDLLPVALRAGEKWTKISCTGRSYKSSKFTSSWDIHVIELEHVGSGSSMDPSSSDS
jgi:hypothetical protein